MTIRGVNIWHLWQKDIVLSIKNKSVVTILLLPIGFSVLYTYMFQDAQDMPSNFVLMLNGIIIITAIPLETQSVLLVEEKEKRTLATLLLSNITYPEYIISKSCVTWFYVIVASCINGAICSLTMPDMILYVTLSLFASSIIILYGTIVGLWANETLSASALSTPFIAIFMIPSIFAYFNQTIHLVARLTPTYAFRNLYETMMVGEYFTTQNFISIVILIVWGIIGIVLLRYTYRKKHTSINKSIT